MAVNTRFVRHQALIRIAAQADAVIRLPLRPGHFLVEGREFISVWPSDACLCKIAPV